MSIVTQENKTYAKDIISGSESSISQEEDIVSTYESRQKS